MDRPDAAPYHQRIALRNGTPAVIRVMRPEDRPRLEAAFAKLDRASVYTWFFSFRKELPERALERIADIDYVHLAGLVATVGAGADETIVGSATYVAAAGDGAASAEVAFTIEEDYQGQGLASRMLATLAEIALRHGIARFDAEVLADNAAMLRVFRRSGLSLRERREDGVIRVEMDLGRTPGPA